MEDNSRNMKLVWTMVERGQANGLAKSYWTKVGVGFVNRDGSITLRLDALPLNGTLQVREWEPFDRRPDAAESGSPSVVSPPGGRRPADFGDPGRPPSQAPSFASRTGRVARLSAERTDRDSRSAGGRISPGVALCRLAFREAGSARRRRCSRPPSSGARRTDGGGSDGPHRPAVRALLGHRKRSTPLPCGGAADRVRAPAGACAITDGDIDFFAIVATPFPRFCGRPGGPEYVPGNGQKTFAGSPASATSFAQTPILALRSPPRPLSGRSTTF